MKQKIKIINKRYIITIILFLCFGMSIFSFYTLPIQTTTEQLFGWGGFVRTYDSVIPLLNKLDEDGWNNVRYYSVPQWAQDLGWGGFDISYSILNHLCDEANNRGMQVILNIAHNFPNGDYLDGNRDDWITEYLYDLTQINAISRTNIIFDIANEYDGTQTNIIAHYNAMISALRNAGYTQTIYLNYWWNHNMATCVSAVIDPLDNFIVGMHHYAQSYSDIYNYSTSGTYEEVCEASEVNNRWSWIWTNRIQPVLNLGVDYFITEIGVGWSYQFNTGRLAFVMKAFELAYANSHFHVTMHCAPNIDSQYSQYYYYANDYFSMSFFTEPITPPSSERLFYDDYETGNFNEWNGTIESSGETSSVVTTNPFNNTYHGKYTTNGGSELEWAYSYKYITSQTEVWMRAYVYIEDGLPLIDNSDSLWIFQLRVDSTKIAYAGIRRTGGFDRWCIQNAKGWTKDYGSNVTTQIYYCVEMYWKKGTTSGILKLWVNGQLDCELVGQDTDDWGNVNRIDVGIFTENNIGNTVEIHSDAVIVDNEYIGIISNIPIWSLANHNTTIAGNPIKFSCKWTDDNGLSGFIFETNNTGTLINETWSSLSGTEAWANITKTLNTTVGLTILYTWYTNDSYNIWGTSETQLLTTTVNIPQFSNVYSNSTKADSVCLFNVKWTDIEGLSGYIFGTNNTGSWNNDTWVDNWDSSPTVAYSQVTKTLNSTVGVTIQWQIWVNDTNNNWNSIELQTLVIDQYSIVTVTFVIGIENVLINGTHLTYATGNYTWMGLIPNQIYTFIIEKPSEYYPKWCLNVLDFSYNETHYLISQNITEISNIFVSFASVQQVYIQSINGTLTDISITEYQYEKIISLSINADSETTSITKLFTNGKGKPNSISGVNYWSYNSVTDLITMNVQHESSQEVIIYWSYFPSIGSAYLYSGTFNLYLEQNGSMGSQLLYYYVAIQHLNTTALNTTATILGRSINDRYMSTLTFKTNINTQIRILTNLNELINHISTVTINSEIIPVENGTIISCLNGDNIKIYFEVSNPVITETHINAILGIIGVGLFCASPVLSYTLSDKAKDKFKFLFILMGVGIISLGLIFSFIYG